MTREAEKAANEAVMALSALIESSRNFPITALMNVDVVRKEMRRLAPEIAELNHSLMIER